MSIIEKSIEVNVPEYTAYAQWTKFWEFPQFMEGVKEVTRLDAKRFHWKAEVAGQEKEWETEITEQVADQSLAWTSRGTGLQGGVMKKVGGRTPQSGWRTNVLRGRAEAVSSRDGS